MRVAVLGAGFAGLSCGHYLLKAGIEPVLFESDEGVGGRAAAFLHDGQPIDRFPQLIHGNDSALIGVMAEHEALGRLVWNDASMSVLADGVQRPLTTPLDLLRFDALRPSLRLRTAWAVYHATRLQRFGMRLDTVPADRWLLDLFGSEVYTTLWQPFLHSVFGDRIDQLPAYWVWERLHREKNGHASTRGALRGGIGWLAEQMRSSIEKRGGAVRAGQPVSGIEELPSGVCVYFNGHEERFDAVISTLRIPALFKIARGLLAARIPNPNLEYRSLVNAVVISGAPLQPYYWTVLGDPDAEFDEIHETTQVIPTEWTGGRHVTHFSKHCREDEEIFRRPDDAVRDEVLRSLAQRFPEADTSSIEAIQVFRARSAQPIWPLGYLDKRPALRTADAPLYLCCNEQAYPRLTTTCHAAVTLARETVSKLRGDFLDRLR